MAQKAFDTNLIPIPVGLWQLTDEERTSSYLNALTLLWKCLQWINQEQRMIEREQFPQKASGCLSNKKLGSQISLKAHFKD